MLIYMATNKVNGKAYIGQTVTSLKKRKARHIRGDDSTMYITRAIKKYGKEEFSWTILHDNITNIDILNKLEIFYIGYYNTFEDGYNLTEGGGGMLGYNPSEKTRQLLSKAGKGKKLSEEHVQAVARANTGRKHSVEIRQRMSDAHKGTCMGKDNSMARAVIADGRYFDTLLESSRVIGVSRAMIWKRIKKQVPGYRYVTK